MRACYDNERPFRREGPLVVYPGAAASVRGVPPGGLLPVDRRFGICARIGGRDAREGPDRIDAVGHRVVLLRMAVPGDGRIQLLLELREQRVVVGAEAAHVVPQIEEERRGVAVEPLEVAEPAGIECVRGVDAPHDVGELLQPGAARDADRAVGIGYSVDRIDAVKGVEGVADALVVHFAEHVAARRGVGESVGHDLRRGTDEVVRDPAQLVGHLDRRHVTVVEEDVLHVQPRPGEGFGQRGDFGPVIGGGPAEPAGQRAVRSGVLPVFPALPEPLELLELPPVVSFLFPLPVLPFLLSPVCPEGFSVLGSVLSPDLSSALLSALASVFSGCFSPD